MNLKSKKEIAMSNFFNFVSKMPKFNSGTKVSPTDYFDCENKSNCHAPNCYCEPKQLTHKK